MTGYLLTSGENNHIYTNPKADRTKTTNDATVRVKNPANAEPCGNFSSKNFSEFSVCKTGNQNLMCEQDSIASQEKWARSVVKGSWMPGKIKIISQDAKSLLAVIEHRAV